MQSTRKIGEQLTVTKTYITVTVTQLCALRLSTEQHLVLRRLLLVHGQVTIIFVVSVCSFVCLSVCAEFFSAVFDLISIKLGDVLYVLV